MILEMVVPVSYYHCPVRRGAGAVERGGLENRCGFAPTVGSNPTLSASLRFSEATSGGWRDEVEQ